MERHEGASEAYEAAGLQILELAQSAYSSYVTKNPHEQARLIKTVVSNSTFDRGSLSPTYVKPFDVFAKGSETGDWLLRLDSEPLAPSDARRGASRWTAWGDETERSEGMAPQAGLEPATLRLTVVTRQIDQRRLNAMKIRPINDLQSPVDQPSITVNVDQNRLLEGVTSQSTSQLNRTWRIVA